MRQPPYPFVIIAALMSSAGCGPADESADYGSEDHALSTTATYQIVGVQSGKCVDIAGASRDNGANAQIWGCSGQGNQQFRFESQGDGTYNVINVNSGRCLDVAGLSQDNGANIQQWDCWGGDNQRWYVTDAGNGAVTLTAKHSGKLVDVAGLRTADGTNVLQWQSTGRNNQQFRLVAVDPSGGSSSSTADCNSATNQRIVTVAQNGSAQYTTMQAAINSISRSNTTPTQIRIAPGTYREKLSIDRPFITLCGQAGKASSTILTYNDNANTPNGSGGTLGTTGGASTTLSANDVSAENVTFENSTPLGGSQAVALLVSGARDQFRNCRFLSYQDTLYVKNGTQYFRDCYVQGSVDYIFGAATAVLENCEAYNAAGGVAVTAPNTDQSVPYGIVFLGGKLTAASSISSGSVTLGRNWGAYGAASYIGTWLGAHVAPVGWRAMGSNTLATARFSEYQTTGPGANPGQRAPESKQLSSGEAAAYTVQRIFGGSWTPSFSR